MTWDRAQEIARAYFVQQGGGPKAPVVQNPRVPYLFRFAEVDILVHDGAVVTAQGVASLSRYLGDLAASDRAALQAADLVVLVKLLGALPPVDGKDPFTFVADATHPGLEPRLDRTGDAAAFHLDYDVTRNADQVADPDLRSIQEWTLAIAADGAASWSRRDREYHRGRNAFVE